MQIRLDYGETGLDLVLPAGAEATTTVIRPRFPSPVPSAAEAIRRVLRVPDAGPPLAERVPEGATVAISVCDPTRAQPRIPMLRAILEEIPTPPERVTLLVATGTHRPAAPAELEAMFGSELLAACEVVNHFCQDESELVRLPDTGAGVPVSLNRRFLEADVRITTGFVEPHFFAGFSGGPKMVAPGLAGMETILVLHDDARIGHPNAVFGVTEGNPVHDDVRAIARQVGVDFALDVLLDGDKRITGVFGGDLLEEHARACVRSHEEAMCPVDQPFEVVVATNSGYPLDQNLYQAVKGMSAAEQIVRQGGSIVIAAECAEGIPEHGLYGQLLGDAADPADLANKVLTAHETRQDQWQAQIQARIQQRADVYVYADGLSDSQIEGALLLPCRDIPALVERLLQRYGTDARIAILPEGPQTIPWLRASKVPEPANA